MPIHRLSLRVHMRGHLRIHENLEQLSRAAAGATVTAIAGAVEAHGSCFLALSGGTTPRRLHELLASEFRTRIPWQHVHVFWGDERYVPHDHPDSNYRMARETLLDHVPCAAANVHPMPTHHADPGVAAAAYEATLRELLVAPWPRLDLALLGLGADGHTASLFPGSPALRARHRWVLAVEAPATPATRLTLTLPLLGRTAHAYFLVTGAAKSAEVARIDAGVEAPGGSPGVTLDRDAGDVVWWVDRDAAGTPHDNGPAHSDTPAPGEEG